MVAATPSRPIPAVDSSATGTRNAWSAARLSAGRSTKTAAVAVPMVSASLVRTQERRVEPQGVTSPSRTPVAGAANADGTRTASASNPMTR
jgi:hypothetical protein